MSETKLSPLYSPIYFNLEKPAELVGKYWFKAVILLIGTYILFYKDVSLQFNLNAAGTNTIASTNVVNQNNNPQKKAAAVPTSYQEDSQKSSKKKVWKDRKANTFSNLTFVLSPSYARRHNVDPDIVQEKKDIVWNYIKKYKGAAREEMEKYGIPMSITLAQGLLESNAGESRLALESNNHFGIKCRRKCRGCTCRNYTDDDIYDMFRVFESPGESFREHSILLTGKRYSHLLKLARSDYEGWSRGLKKAGYATDKRYAEKLIKIIEELKLYRLDSGA